jgi:hypothetical protein
MPERAINTKSATGCLLILLPAALAMSALFVAWPFILGVTLLIAGGNIWQNYEWTKTARSIDPVFQQLVIQNRGEISPIDLSLKANISGNVSQKYLAIRASEFGTGSRQHPDRGQIYYFVSISTLGSIFDDSESDAPALTAAATPIAALPPTPILIPPVAEGSTPAVAIVPVVEVATANIPAIVEPQSPPATAPAPVLEPVSELSNLRQLFDEADPPAATPEIAAVEQTLAPPIAANPQAPLVTIIQSELAKRLDVHSSTIYKRRSEAGFTDWTRNRDPDGLAWGYAEATKEYYQIINN